MSKHMGFVLHADPRIEIPPKRKKSPPKSKDTPLVLEPLRAEPRTVSPPKDTPVEPIQRAVGHGVEVREKLGDLMQAIEAMAPSERLTVLVERLMSATVTEQSAAVSAAYDRGSASKGPGTDTVESLVGDVSALIRSSFPKAVEAYMHRPLAEDPLDQLDMTEFEAALEKMFDP